MISAVQRAHLPAILALNNAHQKETSFLTMADLEALIGAAFTAWQVGDGADAFLITFDEGATYDSPNYRWFADRYDRFVYIDRIVVADHARGRGLARTLYETLFDAAAESGRHIVGCEINKAPPNPNSSAFHEKMGFEAVGEAHLTGANKTVGYHLKRV